MTSNQIVLCVVDALERLNIPYMLVGSYSSNAFGTAAKDLDDAKNVIAVQAGKLDLDYIRRWCDQHGTRSLFEQLLVESRRFEQEQP